MTDKKTVLILPGDSALSAVEMFQNRGWNAYLYNSIWEVEEYFKEGFPLDAVCFMGGTDVDPAIYGEERGPTTQAPDKKRDEFEVSVFNRFKDTDVYLFGICRGAQLLNVLNGGRMIQECGYRGGKVKIIVSNALEESMWLVPPLKMDGRGPVLLDHNVDHHQGMLVGPDADHDTIFGFTEGGIGGLDYVIHYPKTRSYGVQGHPEWGHKETEDLFFAGIDLTMKGN